MKRRWSLGGATERARALRMTRLYFPISMSTGFSGGPFGAVMHSTPSDDRIDFTLSGSASCQS